MMKLPDAALARRLEYHEACSSVEHARIQARLFPQTGAHSKRFGDAYAVFCGEKSPLSQVYGLGLSGLVTASDLDEIETFYRSLDQKVRVCACPLADPALLAFLSEHGYSLEYQLNVHVRQLESPGFERPGEPGLKIEIGTAGEVQSWFEQLGAGGDWAEPDGITFMTIRTTLKPGARLFLAWRDGQPAGGGALEIHDGVAALMAADTLPAFRNQGIHTALLHARLAAAFESGCDLAVVHTTPASPSERNIERAGFQLAYTNSILLRML